MTGSKSSFLSCPRLTHTASQELEQMRGRNHKHADGTEFPLACRQLLYSLPGNKACIDCGAPNPDWASVSYGALMCLRCSGRHRSFGVQTSFVRSIRMDAWNHEQILCMLEGGNDQLQQFFYRHDMPNTSGNRYHTKAAKFYRDNLKKHVTLIASYGQYQGREASRSRHYIKTPEQRELHAVNTACA